MKRLSIRKGRSDSRERDQVPLFDEERGAAVMDQEPNDEEDEVGSISEPNLFGPDGPPPNDVTQTPIQPVLKMTGATYESLMKDLGQSPFHHEQGGILLGPRDAQHLAIRYVKDCRGEATFASFTIDTESLNKAIREVRSAGLTCVGIVHSHPSGFCRPSGGDIEFLERIFAHPKNGDGNGYFLFPIVTNGKLYPYLIDTNDVRRVLVAELVVV